MLRIFDKNRNLEYEFLPSALEIIETPPSPAGRITIWLIFLMLLFAVLWMLIGEVDEVAVARGKVSPDGRVKIIQPLDEGVITAIYVSDGQRVEQGELMIELDSTLRQADVDALRLSLRNIKLERDLLQHFLRAEDMEDPSLDQPHRSPAEESLIQWMRSEEQKRDAQKLALMIEISRCEEQLELSRAEREKLSGEIRLLKEREVKLKELLVSGAVESAALLKLKATIEILTAREEQLKVLFENGAVPKSEWMDKRDELILAQKEYEIQQARETRDNQSLELNVKSVSDDLNRLRMELDLQDIRIQIAEEELEAAKSNLNRYVSERASETFTQIVARDQRILELENELRKAERRLEFQSLTAPVSGVVHALQPNTIGGVVTPAQALVAVIPDNTPLVVEAFLLNKDVGFVHAGQNVAIKFDTFPFQKYGTIPGRVESISADSYDDEKTGAVYRMKVSLEHDVFAVNGQQIAVTPGMTVTVEIKTGKRKIIDFFLEPILKYARESLTVR